MAPRTGQALRTPVGTHIPPCSLFPPLRGTPFFRLVKGNTGEKCLQGFSRHPAGRSIFEPEALYTGKSPIASGASLIPAIVGFTPFAKPMDGKSRAGVTGGRGAGGGGLRPPPPAPRPPRSFQRSAVPRPVRIYPAKRRRRAFQLPPSSHCCSFPFVSGATGGGWPLGCPPPECVLPPQNGVPRPPPGARDCPP